MAITQRHVYTSLFQAFYSILSKEGTRTMYRGLIPTLMGVFPYAGSSFFTYETLKELYVHHYNEPPTPLVKLTAGAFAGLVGQSFSYPLDIVRRRMQTEGVLCQVKYRTIYSTVKYVLDTEGIRGLYKGVSMNWIKGPMAVTISFNTYEIVKNFLKSTL